VVRRILHRIDCDGNSGEVSIRSGCRQSFRAEKLEEAAVEIVGAGLGYYVDDAPTCAAVLGVCATGNDLEFFHGLKCNIDGRALTALLLTKETIVIVAASRLILLKIPRCPLKLIHRHRAPG